MLTHRDPHFYLCRLVDIKWVWCYNTCIEFETQEHTMNERIQELAKQAELNVTLLFNKDKLEKFAELIVRECSTLAYDGPNGILEHFGLGVEE